MFVKWIVCTVAEDKREAFGSAQQAWRRIRYVDGLIAQVGGYDDNNPAAACILAVWRDERSHQQFMANAHDAVTSENHQADHYQDIEVRHFSVVSRMPGQRARLFDALSASRLLRIAECNVKPDRRNHFVRTQLDVWTPGMASAKGMFGGTFLRACADENHFFVITAWQDEELHQMYADHHLPSLRQRAAPDDDLVSMSGRRVVLEPNWTVVGVAD